MKVESKRPVFWPKKATTHHCVLHGGRVVWMLLRLWHLSGPRENWSEPSTKWSVLENPDFTRSTMLE